MRLPYLAHFLTRTHLLASMEETPAEFQVMLFSVLTVRDLNSWCPDRSGFVSQLPQSWSVLDAATLLGIEPILLHRPQA